jgi:DNA-binding NarL/FixJ family response regulator
VERPTVLLGDDHVMFTDGLRTILNPHFEIVGTAENGEDLVAAAERLHPDVIVLDISMPLLNGIKAARKLQTMGTSSKIVFCTMQTDPVFVTEAFHAGAVGYVLKSAAGSEIIAAISEALHGRTYVSPRMARSIVGPPD